MMTNEEMISELTLRKISSSDFIIKTKAIHDLENKLLSWLSTTACGGIVYGRARIGKTKALNSIAETIRQKYGENFPVIIWNVTDHAVTEKNFYTSLLMAMGLERIPTHSTALALKERCLNELAMAAYETAFRKVVIMLDEAWKLSEKDFAWLMDLYNNLNRKDILLTCFLFGTKELKGYKSTLKSIGQDQIVGRFMINEFQFFGMLEPQELMLCLLAFDKMTTKTEWGGSDTPLIDFFFPNHEESRFCSLADSYWTAFMQVKAKHNIKSKDIPMKYMIDSFILLLQRYGRFSSDHIAFPGIKELVECVELSGYGESDEEYISNHKGRKLA